MKINACWLTLDAERLTSGNHLSANHNLQLESAAYRWSIVRLCLLCIFALGGILLIAPASQVDATSVPFAAPIVITVSPDHVYNDQTTIITVTGAGFVATPIVTLVNCGGERVVLSNVTFINSMLLTGTVPSALPEGHYFLTVINPDGQLDRLKNFTMMRRSDGSLGPWQQTSAMLISRQKFAAVAVNSYLYALGGNDSSVERATINADGSLGAWQFTSSMRKSRSGLAVVAVGNYLYALGGDQGSLGPYYASVERAAVNGDGSLGAWEIISAMTTPRVEFTALAKGDYLYAFGGFSGESPPVNSVERAKFNADGTLGPWQLTTAMTIPRSRVVRVGNYFYALGSAGVDGATSVERSEVHTDGSLGTWSVISAMTTGRAEFATVVAGDYVYALGGFITCIDALNSVERVKTGTDSNLDAWRRMASMFTARAKFEAVAVGNYVYALGGYTGGDSLDTTSVEWAEINQIQLYLPAIAR